MAFVHGFVYTPSTPSPLPPLSATLIWVQIKVVEVVHLWTKFHLDGTCISGVLIFEIFV